jgi:hypothetical protein
MSRDPVAGTMLIAGSLLGVVVMALHPTGQTLAQDFERQARLGAIVHGVAIASVPLLFLGFLGLARRLAPSRLAVAALVTFGWGAVAVLSAAVMSGFVSTALIRRMMEADDAAAKSLYHALADTSFLMNQGYAKVYFVASMVAIILFSAAIVRTGRLAPWVGSAGVVVASVLLLLYGAGHLTMDVHGFGAMMIAQSLWSVAVGALLCRDAPPEAARD